MSSPPCVDDRAREVLEALGVRPPARLLPSYLAFLSFTFPDAGANWSAAVGAEPSLTEADTLDRLDRLIDRWGKKIEREMGYRAIAALRMVPARGIEAVTRALDRVDAAAALHTSYGSSAEVGALFEAKRRLEGLLGEDSIAWLWPFVACRLAHIADGAAGVRLSAWTDADRLASRVEARDLLGWAIEAAPSGIRPDIAEDLARAAFNVLTDQQLQGVEPEALSSDIAAAKTAAERALAAGRTAKDRRDARLFLATVLWQCHRSTGMDDLVAAIGHLRALRRSPGLSEVDRGIVEVNLGNALRDRARVRRGRRDLDEAVALLRSARRAPLPEVVQRLGVMGNLSAALLERHGSAGRTADLLGAVRTMEAMLRAIGRIPSAGLQLDQRRRWQDTPGDAIGAYLDLAELRPARRAFWLRRALSAAEQAKSDMIREQLVVGSIGVPASVPQALVDEVRNVLADFARLDSSVAWQLRGDVTRPAAFAARRRGLERRLAAAWDAVAATGPAAARYVAVARTTPVWWRAVLAATAPAQRGALFLSFYVAGHETVLFALERGDDAPRVVSTTIETEAWHTLLEGFYRTLGPGRAHPTSTPGSGGRPRSSTSSAAVWGTANPSGSSSRPTRSSASCPGCGSAGRQVSKRTTMAAGPLHGTWSHRSSRARNCPRPLARLSARPSHRWWSETRRQTSRTASSKRSR